MSSTEEYQSVSGAHNDESQPDTDSTSADRTNGRPPTTDILVFGMPLTVLAVFIIYVLLALTALPALLNVLTALSKGAAGAGTAALWLCVHEIVLVLLLIGMAGRVRIAWQAILLLNGAFLGIATLMMLIVSRPSLTEFAGYLTDRQWLVLFGPVIISVACMLTRSARRHFDLLCWECGRRMSSVDSLYIKVRCEHCEIER